MTKTRLEAFSDGVLAIVITIMVLELKVPHGESFEALKPLVPLVLSYVLSFCYIGIYWANHHHLFQVVRTVRGDVLWANLHLLFWLSLFPFATAWLGEHSFGKVQCFTYGVVLIGAAAAYKILVVLLLKHHDPNSTLARALGKDTKGNLSLILYATGVALSFYAPIASCGLYVLVALLWVIPDTRIERRVEGD